MCTNLSLLHTAGRVTDGVCGWRGMGDGPPPPPWPGWSRMLAQQENDGHLYPGRQGRHSLASAETQDMNRNQQMAPPSESILELGGHLGRTLMGWMLPIYPPHLLSSLLRGLGDRSAWTAPWATWPSASGSVQPMGSPGSKREGRE